MSSISQAARQLVTTRSAVVAPAGPWRGRRAYASGLDGIRAIAVLCVVLFHAGVPGFRGGFVGVDLFFVVSGYLVTALLQREHDLTGRLDILAFIRRRARRLLPALAFMLIVVCALTLMLGRDLGAGLRTELLGAFTFSSNWLQISSGNSYLNVTEPALLTHLWSLAVEEQFYFLWPTITLLLLGVVKQRHRRVLLAVAAALVSAALMATIFSAGADPTRVYVGTDSHGFGLLLGAALALARPSSAVDPVLRVRLSAPTGFAALVGPAALITVLAGVVLLTDSSTLTFRGGLFGVNVAAVVLVAVALRDVGPVARLLGHRALRWWGLRSYSLYLWHWPALVIADRVLAPSVGRPVSAVVAIGGAILAADISWRWLEQPVRRLGIAGYLRSVRTTLLGRPVRARRRSVGWVVTGSFALVLGLAACSVVIAPDESELADSLAAGERALAQATAAMPAPADDTHDSATSTRQAGSSGPVRTFSASSAPTSPARPGHAPAPAASTTAVRPPAASTNAASTIAVRPPAASTTAASTTAVRPPAASTKAPVVPVPAPVKAARPPVPVAAPVAAVTGTGLSAIGDSVMLASATALLQRFPGADIDAVVSRQLWDLGSVIAPKLTAGTLRGELVVGLGTNGTDSAGHIEAALAQVPAGEVVILVNSYVPDSWQDEANANLAAAAASRPHTCLADWHGAISARTDLLGPDQVHPSGPGGDLYAAVIARAAEHCR